MMRVLLLLAGLTLAAPLQSVRAADGYDKYGGRLSLPGQKTGWFHVEQIQGRWYFVTPDGNAFFSLGATHANDCITKDELGLFQSKYQGSEERLSKFLLSQLRDVNYNSAGYGALKPMETQIPYAAVLWIEGPVSLAAGTQTSFADVFDPAVQERIGETIRKQVARHKDNPWCLGYYFLDIPTWHNEFNRTKPKGSYVDAIRALKREASGRQAYVHFLQQRYGADLTAFNAAYGLAVQAIDDSLDVESFSARAQGNAVMAEDDDLFLAELADAYFSVASRELRKVDPNHLILGDRFMADPKKTSDRALKAAARHLDVISFQPMGTAFLAREYIDHVHKLTGKPVLYGDVNCVPERRAKDIADTEAYERAVAEHTHAYYIDAVASKALIGLHRCTMRDYQPWNTKFFRCGFLKADDSPYPLLRELNRKTHDEVFKIVYGER